MPVIHLDIRHREPYADGMSFGESGSYERIDGIVTFAVNPENPANQSIVDLDLAPRDENGLVQFSSDLVILTPADPSKGKRRAMVELPNRGRKLSPRQYNRSTVDVSPNREIPAGDGFLFRHGFTVAWIGWQWDVYRSEALMGLDAPRAMLDGSEVEGQAVVEIHPSVGAKTWLLANRLHRPNPVADLDDPDAILTVRDYEDGEDTIIPRDRWRFARESGNEVVPSREHIYYEDGFEPGKLYHVIYRAHGAPVVGTGLLAVRDIGAFLKSDADLNPVAGAIDRIYAFGISQTGRMLRHFLYLGLNTGEDGQQVYDGIIPHVAGGRRGEFNHRFAQPSVQSTPGFGHRFPFAGVEMEDIYSPSSDGLFNRLRTSGHMPKVIFSNTSAEYWRGDSSLMHTDPAGTRDVDPEPDTRIYLYASTQHGPGNLPQGNVNANDGSVGRYGFNLVEYTPLLRAQLINMDRWVAEGLEPPPNAFPRIADGSAVSNAQVLEHFRAIPGMHLPDSDRLPVIREVDLGPDADKGIGRYPVVEGGVYPAYVSNVDSDGNEVAGIKLPDVTVPIATNTGWNPRHPDTGGADQIMAMQGFTMFFPRTKEEREATGDPRLSIEERYSSKEAYLAEVRKQAEALAHDRYILEEDIETVVSDASLRWDVAMGSA
jgi:hypothetical protein